MINQKKKILYVVEAMGGGVFSYLVDLVNQLVNEYDIYIAYALRPQTPENFKDYFDKRVNYIEVKNFVREINVRKELKAVYELKRIERQIKPDIIHLHSSKAGVIGRIAFNGKDVPVFYTPHGYSFLMSNYGGLKRNLFRAIEFICAKRNCRTISCSRGEHNETLKLTKNAEYVNNGIDIDKLYPILRGIKTSEHPFTVFTSGRICYQKNPSKFNEIAESLPNIKFLWIGDGDLRSELKAPNIEILGWMDRVEVLKAAMSADAFVLTSLWEGLPISLLEAMLMKKICLVSNCIGNRDVIQNNVNGFLCDSVEDYVDGIMKAKNKEVDDLINAAFKDVNEKYGSNVQFEKYKKIYKNAIHMKGAK